LWDSLVRTEVDIQAYNPILRFSHFIMTFTCI